MKIYIISIINAKICIKTSSFDFISKKSLITWTIFNKTKNLFNGFESLLFHELSNNVNIEMLSLPNYLVTIPTCTFLKTKLKYRICLIMGEDCFWTTYQKLKTLSIRENYENCAKQFMNNFNTFNVIKREIILKANY